MSAKDSVFAVCRFGLGAKPGEVAAVGGDPRGWIMSQLAAPVVPSEVLRRSIDGSTVMQFLKAGKDNKADKKNDRRAIQEAYVNETGNRLIAQIKSNQPFVERMVLFWSNHFTVSIQKPLITGIVNQYEVEAIRPHINGYFKDMLLAVARHPAMLLYLDNARSFGANSAIGIRRGKGLNENLAREILELHTLGVGGGYTQNDVIALAKIITGWTISRDSSALAFEFQESTHEPGPKTLLGKTFNEGGEEEGTRALTMLASHPATARHLATKIARHFISDTPSESSVKVIEQAYIKTGGHLPSVMRAVVDLDETWTSPRVKFKTPYEFAVSTLRLTGIQPTPEQAVKGLDALNFRPFNASSPAGYDDIAASWASPDAIMKRIEWGHKIALRLPAGTDPMRLAGEAFSSTLTDTTAQGIIRAASGADGVALLLASPEFQRR